MTSRYEHIVNLSYPTSIKIWKYKLRIIFDEKKTLCSREVDKVEGAIYRRGYQKKKKRIRTDTGRIM